MSRYLPMLVGLILLVVSGSDAAGTDLGRLFFTPRERASLDRQRNASQNEASGIDERPALTINGEIRRHSGTSVRWINGVVRYRHPTDDSDGHPESPAYRLRVGETWDPATRQARDLLGDGSIVVHRPQ